MNTWHVVHSTGIVHAVYGAALREFADERASKIPLAVVTTVTGDKPKIGDKFSPKPEHKT